MHVAVKAVQKSGGEVSIVRSSIFGESARFRLGLVFLLDLQDGCVFQLQLCTSGNQVIYAGPDVQK